jgi:hypothetical protein
MARATDYRIERERERGYYSVINTVRNPLYHGRLFTKERARRTPVLVRPRSVRRHPCADRGGTPRAPGGGPLMLVSCRVHTVCAASGAPWWN